MRYDRDELLARTDLAALADELLGYHVGDGRNARWPSPVPNHPQTGRTPPMSIFVDHRGIERWTCFATGANGTAIDLVVTATGRSVGDSMTWLANRARLDRPPLERAPVVLPRHAPPLVAREPSAALRAYVQACERILWEPAGASIRRWLVEERCLDPEVLRRNRIGADPGPRTLPRAKGLPRGGPAALFPALDDEREPVYLQARYLDPPPDRGKYDNPTGRHGSNPRLTAVEPRAEVGGPTIITEGVPDALAVASIGYHAAAVLGAGLPDRRVAERLGRRPGLLVVAFDRDDPGRSGSARLVEQLRDLGRFNVMAIEPPAGDLNTWLVSRSASSFRRQLDRSIKLLETGISRPGVGRSIA